MVVLVNWGVGYLATIKSFRQDLLPVVLVSVILEEFMFSNALECDPQVRLCDEDLIEKVPSCRVDQVTLVPDITLDDRFLNRHRVVLVLKWQTPNQEIIKRVRKTYPVRSSQMRIP